MRTLICILLLASTAYASIKTTRQGGGGGGSVGAEPEPEASNYFVDPETGNHFSDSEGGTFIDPE